MKLISNLSTLIFASITAVSASGCIVNTETTDEGAERVDSVSEEIASAPKMGTTVSTSFSAYKPLGYLCDAPDYTLGVYAVGATPNPRMFFYYQGSTAATDFLDGDASSLPSGAAGSTYWEFSQPVVGSHSYIWTLQSINNIDSANGYSLYSSSYRMEYTLDGYTESGDCRNPKGTVVQCITKSRSVYVTKVAGTLGYKAYSFGGTTPDISLTNGVYAKSTASNMRASVSFTTGAYKYVVRFSPHDATFFKGDVLIYKNGAQIGSENCDLMTLGKGSPGVNQSI